MSTSDGTCSEEGCNEPPIEDYERCAHHRAKLEESRQAWVKGGLSALGTVGIVVLSLFGRGNGGGSS